MRRSDRKIGQKADIDKIINNVKVCRLAFANDNIPYLIPVSFGYDGTRIFLHTAKQGKKIDFIANNNNVCFEFDDEVQTISDIKLACNWTTAYKSVVGNGKIYELTNYEEQENAINQIMLHYSGKKWNFNENMLKSVKLWKIEIDDISGKMSGY